MTRRPFLLIAFWAFATAAPALACDDSPDLDILPGETRKTFDERYNQTWERLRIVDRYEGQKSLLAKSRTAYLGQVSSHRDLPGTRLQAVVVRPVRALKGKLPASPQTLTDTAETSCGPKGDGNGTSGREGEWVFVFGGLPKSEWRPHGIDSILAEDALAGDLFGALHEVGSNPDAER